MERSSILIIVLVIILFVVGGFIFFGFQNNNVEFGSIQLTDTCSIEVPKANGQLSTDEHNITHYIDNKNNVEIFAVNREKIDLSGGVLFASERDSILTGDTAVNGNLTYYHNTKTGYYSVYVFNNTTHDNIVISSKDPKLLEKIVASIKYAPVKEETVDTAAPVQHSQPSNNSSDVNQENNNNEYNYEDYESYYQYDDPSYWDNYYQDDYYSENYGESYFS